MTLWSDNPPGKHISWPCLEVLQVMLTFGQMCPQQKHLVAKSGSTSGQADLWSDVPPIRDISLPSLELLQVMLTFGHMYPQ